MGYALQPNRKSTEGTQHPDRDAQFNYLNDQVRSAQHRHIRNCWRDGETSKVVEGQMNVIYTFDGEVSCVCPKTGTERSMIYGGFERDRTTLKYRCLARALGAECNGMQQCPVGTAVRIRLSEDRRVFTPVARSSYGWKDRYDQRSAVERVSSRLAGPFGFDDPFIRRLAKMRLRCTLVLSIMLAMALGRGTFFRRSMATL